MDEAANITDHNIFSAKTPNIYTMPSASAFLPALAQGLKSSLGDDLSKAMVLLPTRRAVRDLAESFLALSGGKAAFLPIMRTLADMDENEPPFEPGQAALSVAPSIDTARRRFELAKLVAAKMGASGNAPDAAGALSMTEPLISLLNDLAMEELGTDALSILDDDLERLPKHFQEAAEFSKIVTAHWPLHLEAMGLSEPMERRVALLRAAAKAWQDNPPNHPVIIAGSTGTLAATANLIKTVAGFDKGCIILPGLDTHIDEAVWEKIDDQHPQASLKNLINVLGITRGDIPNWPAAALSHNGRMRERILSESLIPADQTSDWPTRIGRIRDSASAGDPLIDGLSGLSIIEARHEEEEAALIAVMMREALETKDKTCALVTPDPSLARRVRARLSRWHIEVDSSAGEPLEETVHGSFLSLCLDAALDPFSPVVLSGLVRHKLFERTDDYLPAFDAFEIVILRGARARSYAAMERKFKQAEKWTEKPVLEIARKGFALLKTLHDGLRVLGDLAKQDSGAAEFAMAHTQVIENLAGGAHNIWREEAGEKAASLIEEILVYGEHLPNMDGIGYQRLLSTLMRGIVVRPRYGTETRLKILGPLEARMLEADTVILGGLNDGIWPAHPAPHPILSRGMRLQIGLSAPERRFGLSAHDFAGLACKPNVILTRAARSGDGPSVMSRWLWRLTTLVRGGLGQDAKKAFAPPRPYLEWARNLDIAPSAPAPETPPAPCPDLMDRWPMENGGRKLSVTQISKWIRNPYGIYASKILGLKGLGDLDEELGGREFGSAIHLALEKFIKEENTGDVDLLTGYFRGALLDSGYEEHSFSRYNVRLEAMAKWVVDWIASRRVNGWEFQDAEKYGTLTLNVNGENFTLSGIADLVETRGDEAAILDYKTGVVSTRAQVQAGFDPQLPLMAAMLSAGALGASTNPADLVYVKPNAKKESARTMSLLTKDWGVQEYQNEAVASLEKLISYFDEEETAYYCQPRPQYMDDYSDYDHLARRDEWAKISGGDHE